MKRSRGVFLVIDGWGVARPGKGNPISQAKITYYPKLLREYPPALLGASGPDVGLPLGQVGNSEAGHMNLGAGRVVPQDSVRINAAIDDGSFFRTPELLEGLRFATKKNVTLHIMTLLTDDESGHAYPKHLDATLAMARKEKVARLRLHFFTDGRDTALTDARRLLQKRLRTLKPNERVVTLMGRFYGMDRAKRWDRTATAFDALTRGIGERTTKPLDALDARYKNGETDEFLQPLIVDTGDGNGRIHDGDAVLFLNLRSDRARQLTKAFVQEDFETMNPGSFQRRQKFTKIHFVAFTGFGPDLPRVRTAFPPQLLSDTLPTALKEFRQLYLSESEKFAQITYFFNGGHAQPVAGEDRMMVPSSNIASFVDRPALATPELVAIIERQLRDTHYDVIVANLANADMVGHTGNLVAGLAAVRVIDDALRRIVTAVQAAGAHLLVTADHGNIERMIDQATQQPDSKHNDSPVPCIVVSEGRSLLRFRGVLADAAPTFLDLMGAEQPSLMTGSSLFVEPHGQARGLLRRRVKGKKRRS